MPEYQFVHITNTNILIYESSDAPFSSLKISLLNLKFQLPSIKFSKFFANRVLPFLFRYNLFVPRKTLSSIHWQLIQYVLLTKVFFLALTLYQPEIFPVFLFFSNSNIRKIYCSVRWFLFSFTDNFLNIVQKIHIVCEVVST